MKCRFTCISVLISGLLVVLGGGCGKSKSPEASRGGAPRPTAPASTPSDVAARVHWVGMKRLAADRNAASFMAIWNLPETARLEAQTLDKLALALAGDKKFPIIDSHSLEPATNAPFNYQCLFTNFPIAALLRPLLEDLVQEELCLQIRDLTNQPGEFALGIRLSNERAALWQTNLAAAVEALAGAPRMANQDGHGWQAQVSLRGAAAQTLSMQFELARSPGWTFIGLAPGENSSLRELESRVESDPALAAGPESSGGATAEVAGSSQQPRPTAAPTNHWIEAYADPMRAASVLGCGENLGELPRISFVIFGDGQNVVTRGQLDFAKSIPCELEPWNIPTNIIGEPLASFTAARGIRPWLSAFKAWNDLQLGTPPNQFYSWGKAGTPPFQTYCAAPMANASNWVSGVADRAVKTGGPWIASNSMGRLERATNFNGASWVSVAYMSAFLRSIKAGGGEFAYAGLSPHLYTNLPPSPTLLHQIVSRTNLVYYDWELTGSRIESWIHIGQLFRLLFLKDHLPPSSASLQWLVAVMPRLENSVTAVTETGPNRLTFARISNIGFTALELHLVADWLESCEFPHGLNTFTGPSRVLRQAPKSAAAERTTSGTVQTAVARIGTNAAAAKR